MSHFSSKSLYNLKVGKYIFFYLWGTYLIYLLLPYEMQNEGAKEVLTVVFLFFVSLSFYLGCSTVSISKSKIRFGINYHPIISEVVLDVCLVLCTVFTFFYAHDLISHGIGSWDLSLGENYTSYYNAELSINSRWGQLYVLSSPLKFFLLSYCLLIFHSLKPLTKVLYFVFLVVTILFSLTQGKNVGIAYVLAMIVSSYLLVCIMQKMVKQFRRNTLLAVVLFAAFFIINTSLRIDAYGGEYDASVLDHDNIIIRIFGVKFGSGILRLCGYFSHGYGGLNYCLQLPFEWTHGYGGAMGIDSYVTQYLHLPSEIPNTYPGRMEVAFGRSGLLSWPTVFPWWASDITFPGVVALMFIIGRFVCILLKESLIFGNTLSSVLFSYFSILLVCLPLNNQLLQTRGNFIATFILLLLWILFHKRFNKGQHLLI